MTDQSEETTLVAQGHGDLLVKYARTELRRRKLTDVTVVCAAREEVAAHRLLLSAFSQHFAAALMCRGLCFVL